jgi:hypothetical protein
MIKYLLTGLLMVWAGSFDPADGLPCSAGPPCSACGREKSAGWQGETGIEGSVYLSGGNRMPAPGHTRGPLHGVRSTVYIYGLTNINQVVRVGQSPYYSAIQTELMRQADTDDTGYFKVLLPAGHYSLFTKKGDLFFASRMDDRNNIAPVKVLPGKVTKVECRVESGHKAVY